MVCLGNICRSPLAQGILEHKCRERGLSWQVDSAGTGNWHFGSPPDKRSIEVARKYGIDIRDQRARTINSSDFTEFDRIYAMDMSNYQHLLKWALDDEEKNRIAMIMEEVSPGDYIDVPDPYFDDDGFEQVYRMLDDACEKIIEKYR